MQYSCFSYTVQKMGSTSTGNASIEMASLHQRLGRIQLEGIYLTYISASLPLKKPSLKIKFIADPGYIYRTTRSLIITFN